MTWERAKRWLAEHPAVTLTPLMLMAAVALLFLISALLAAVSGITPVVILVISVAMAMLATGALLGWSYWLGVLLQRSGQSAKSRLKAGAMLGCLISTPLILLPAVAYAAFFYFVASGKESPEEFRSTVTRLVIALIVVAASPVVTLGVVLLGATVARRIYRRKIALGQWETTIPAPPGPGRQDGAP